ncbi:hypothetical protein [Paenibacillus sp. XY044]|uniref:hypothetical protein n=1 Tax=Paenibacillus sp. XY044 TaxID=2026089 RepID=UPI000B99C6A6|nr:hypothetical protein [Paenibacillus sp. XY044]OZB94294.1 hypothetical protein CJP46_19005 [Paenibacillus sp. XY044]
MMICHKKPKGLTMGIGMLLVAIVLYRLAESVETQVIILSVILLSWLAYELGLWWFEQTQGKE